MADILLSVGMQVGSADSKEFINQLKSIVNGLNSAENVKAKVGVQIDPASISDIRKKVSEISDFMKTSLGSVRMDNSGISEFTTQLKQMRDAIQKMSGSNGLSTEIAKENALEAYRSSAQKAIADLKEAFDAIKNIHNEITRTNVRTPQSYLNAESQFLREYIELYKQLEAIEKRLGNTGTSRRDISNDVTKITGAIQAYNQLFGILGASTRQEYGLSAIQMPKYNLESFAQSTSAIKNENQAVEQLNQKLTEHAADVEKAATAETQKAGASQSLSGALSTEAAAAESAAKSAEKDASAKAAQSSAYSNATQTVRQYYKLMNQWASDQGAWADITRGENGFVSASGAPKYAELAAQLTATATAFDLLTSAEAKNGLTAQQQAELQALIAQMQSENALKAAAAQQKAIEEEEKAADAAEKAAEKKAAAAEKAAEKKAKADEKATAAAEKAAEKEAAAAEKAAEKKARAAEKEVQDRTRVLTAIEGKIQQINDMMSRTTQGTSNYKALEELRDKYRELFNAVESGSEKAGSARGKLEGLNLSFKQLTGQVKSSSNSIQLFGGGLSMLYSRINYFLSLSNMILQAVRAIKQMVQTTAELDASLTQLQIVTGVSGETIQRYGITAAQTAQQIGGSTKDLIDSATVFARLGYSLEESNILSKYTNMLQNVGAIDASTAQNAITAIVKAFDIDVSQIESIMDEMVKIGNNFPISVSEIAEGMNNAGSALHAAGNSFEQSVALLTAANTTIQNISKSSTGLRTITARIRKTKVELDDLGEAIETAKYQEMIDILTKYKVALTDNGEYRATYDILKDIASVWQELSSMEQAAVAEQLSGTRQQNVFYAMMEQWQEAEDAMASMEESTGALEEAYAVFAESIQGHVNTFKAAFAELAQTFTDSGFMKDVIDFGTKLINTINGIVKLSNQLGGLRNTVMTVVSAILILKPMLVAKLFTGAIDGVKFLVRGMVSFLDIIPACITAWKSWATSAATGAAGAATFGAAMQATIPVIGLVLAAITAVTAGISYYRSQADEANRQSIEAANSASSLGDEVYDLTLEYSKLSEAVKTDSGAKEDLINTQDKLIEKLGIEQSRIRDLAREYGSYTDAIKAASIEELKKQEIDLRAGVNAAKNIAITSFGDLFNNKDFFKIRLEVPNDDVSAMEDLYDAAIKLQQVGFSIEEDGNMFWAMKQRAEQTGEQGYTPVAVLDIHGDASSIDDLIGTIEDLETVLNVINHTAGSDTPEYMAVYEVYSSLKDVLSDYQEQVSSLNDNLIQQLVIQGLIGKDIPKTIDGFLEYRAAVIRAANASGKFVDSGESVADCVDSILKGYTEFSIFYNETGGVMTAVEYESDAARSAAESAEEAANDAEVAAIEAEEAANDAEEKTYKSVGDILSEKEKEFSDKRKEYDRKAADKIANALTMDIGPITSQDLSDYLYSLRGKDNFDEFHKWELAIERGAKTLSEAQRIVDTLTDDNIALITEFNRLAAEPLGKEFAEVLDDISVAANNSGMSINEFLTILGAFDSATITNIHNLTSLKDELNGATAALDEYNKAISGEHGEVASQFDSAYDKFLEDWESGRTGTKAVQAAVELFLSDDMLRDLDYDMQKAGEFLSSDFFKALFSTEEGDPGANFANYIRENKRLFEGIAQITENKEVGGFDFAYSSIEDLAYVTGMSEEAVAALLDSLDAYGIQVMMSAKDTADLATQLGLVKGQAVSTSEEIQNVANNLALSGKKSTEILQIMRSLEQAGYIDLSGVDDQLTDIISAAGEYYLSPDESPLIKIDADISGVESGVSKAESLLDKIDGRRATTYIDTVRVKTKNEDSIDGQASGTTNASGGPTLVNERGPEIISENGQAFIAGGGKPTVVDLDRGAIVLNASDTRRALRGRLFRGGRIRAAADGIAGKIRSTYIYCPICGAKNPRGRTICSVCGSPLAGGAIKPISATLRDAITEAEEALAGGGGGGGGGGGDSSNEKQKIDWIAIAIDRIQRAVSKLQKVASSAFKKLDTRLKASKDAVKEITKEIDIMQAGYERYLKEAESVGLDADLAARVRDGTIDINEYDEDTSKKIQEYQQWYEKAIDCRDAIDELHESIAQLYLDNFNNAQQDFEHRLSEIEHDANMVEKDISMAEAHGYLESAQFYETLSKNTSDRIGMLNDELASLNKMFDEAMASGEIEEGSDAWYEMKDAIAGVEEELGDANVQLVEYAKRMREIEWSYFDYAQEKLGQIKEEADFLIELLSNKELFTDNGQFTEYGMATIGMRVVNYETAMAKADEYAAELQRIEKEIANDPYNNDLISRREELLKLQRESILSAESEKSAVKDLVEQGIQKELSALKDLMDAYKDSLDSAKDLYEYQKKVTEQTSAIADLEKQLAAYQGDTSQENRARIQKLQKQLREAQTSLQETEREKSISDQKKMLDELYKEYEEQLNKRLDDIDALMDEMIDIASVNRDNIQEIVSSLGGEVGYNVTEGMMTVLGDEFSGYHGMFDHVSGIHVHLAQIHSLIAAMAEASGATKAYAKGGLIDYTGLAAVHGTPGNPEMVLSAADTERFLEAAALMRGVSGMSDLSKYGSIGGAGFAGTVINGLSITIPIDHVQDYNDMIAQMQRDPKFDKLINTLTLDRVTGKSQLGKYGIRL